MGLEYIQLFADMEALFEPYDDAQRGRLMMAMMAYAYRGEEPAFAGVEKFIWPVLKQHIDRCAANVEAKKAAGSKGGKRKAEESENKQSEAEESKAKQNEAEESKGKQKSHNHDHDNDHDNDHEQEHDHKQEKISACARGEAPAASAPAKEDEPIIGIDGEDLSGAMMDYDRAGDLVARYKMPDTDQSRAALIEDAAEHGWEKVEAALKDAANGNSRDRLSVNFYRAVLKNQGKPRAAAQAPGKGTAKAFDSMLRHSEEERKKTYSAAIVDFDEEDGP